MFIRAIQLVVLLFFLYSCYLMAEITLAYIPINTEANFLAIKQTEVEGYFYYLPVFYIHVFTAIFALPAGFTQFNKWFLKNHKLWHRRLGYLYVISILAFAAPTGLIMGLHANGGWIAQILFSILSIGWWYSTWKALQTAKNKQFVQHRNWMIRSFALTLSAITLRWWKYILVRMFHPNPMDLYVVIAGLGWIPNILIAEIFFVRHSFDKILFRIKSLIPYT